MVYRVSCAGERTGRCWIYALFLSLLAGVAVRAIHLVGVEAAAGDLVATSTSPPPLYSLSHAYLQTPQASAEAGEVVVVGVAWLFTGSVGAGVEWEVAQWVAGCLAVLSRT